MIKWDEKYETGIKEIDHQHQWIFQFANDLENQLNDKSQSTNIEHALLAIQGYAKKHFKYEEQCMDKCQCPVAAKNQCAHDNFIWAYENFMERYMREGHSEELAWKIHDMVETWITNHICKIDVELRKCSVSKL